MIVRKMSFILILATLSSLSTKIFGGDIQSPQLIAVKFHADWCGSCKKMGTVFTDLQNKFDGQPVLFVTLDRTNMSTRNQSELLASALGLKNTYVNNSGTGFILLIEPNSNKVLKKITATQTIKEMAKEISDSMG